MPSSLTDIQIPPAVAASIDRILYIFLGLVLLWLVLKTIGYFMRRAYNLTSAEASRSKNIKPDFLKVDHKQREQLIDRGRVFDESYSPPAEKAASLTRYGVLISGIISFASAVFFALGRVEDYDEIWKKLSAWDRFTAIIKSHPVGFVIALIMVAGGVIQLMATLRKGN